MAGISRWADCGSPVTSVGLISLLRQQRIGSVPVVRRRIFLKAANSRFVEIVEQVERSRVVGAATALDRGESAFPIAAAITGQHLDGQVAQALEAAGLHRVLAAGDGVDDLRLLLALDHDKVELENGEL